MLFCSFAEYDPAATAFLCQKLHTRTVLSPKDPCGFKSPPPLFADALRLAEATAAASAAHILTAPYTSGYQPQDLQ